MILIALGANQPSSAGQPADTLHAALARLGQLGVEVAAVSRFFSSPAWPDPSDPPFTNAVAHVRTQLHPEGLLALLHAIEEQFGRERRMANAPRTLDLDIIDYEGRVHAAASGLILPHSRAHQRAFVLAPLLDVAPDWVHPATRATGTDLLSAVTASGQVATPVA